jgi:hypothetical protein
VSYRTTSALSPKQVPSPSNPTHCLLFESTLLTDPSDPPPPPPTPIIASSQVIAPRVAAHWDATHHGHTHDQSSIDGPGPSPLHTIVFQRQPCLRVSPPKPGPMGRRHRDRVSRMHSVVLTMHSRSVIQPCILPRHCRRSTGTNPAHHMHFRHVTARGLQAPTLLTICIPSRHCRTMGTNPAHHMHSVTSLQDYGHQPGQINYWLPLAPAAGANTLMVEPVPARCSFHAIKEVVIVAAPGLYWGRRVSA